MGIALVASYYYLEVNKQEQQTKIQVDKNQKIIDQFYFYADRFALAQHKEGDINKYGFIDKNGDTPIPFDYDYALPFDDQGYAKVGIADINLRTTITYYLIDTTNTRYLLATYIAQLNPQTEALDLHHQDLKKLPAKVCKYPNLKILLLADNQLTQRPKQAPNQKTTGTNSLTNTYINRYIPHNASHLPPLLRLDFLPLFFL